MIPDKPCCIVCKQEGKPAVCQRVPIQPRGKTRTVKLATATGEYMLVESGDLALGNMVGPGSPPSDFPGDPTGEHYYGSGASAFIYFHPECKGQSVEEYNAFTLKFSPQMADDEEWAYDSDKPASEGAWRAKSVTP